MVDLTEFRSSGFSKERLELKPAEMMASFIIDGSHITSV
jgi:hypothetical protein